MDMHHSFGDIFSTALSPRRAVSCLLLGRLSLLLLIRSVCHIPLLLAFGRRRFFASDGFARSLAGARIGMRALPAHRQISAMALPTIRSHVEMPLDVARDIAPEIAFDLVFLLDHLADLGRIVIAQTIAF